MYGRSEGGVLNAKAISSGSALLERLGFSEVERRTNAAIAFTWIFLWLVAAATTRILTGEWHGLSWGFVVGGALSLAGTWLFYVRPARRRRIAAKLNWRDGIVEVVVRSGTPIARIELSRPHRALLVAAKGEGRALLRMEQMEPSGRPSVVEVVSTRIDLYGPLPVVLPMKIVGEARSLRPLEDKSRVQRRGSAFGYRMGASDILASEQMTELLAFIEAHREHRIDRVVFPLHEGTLSVGAEKLAIDVRGEMVAFDTQDEPSLRIAVETAARAVPPRDDSVESLVINHAVRRILLRRFPEHPLLETLRR
jgi:hypothetical protein